MIINLLNPAIYIKYSASKPDKIYNNKAWLTWHSKLNQCNSPYQYRLKGKYYEKQKH